MRDSENSIKDHENKLFSILGEKIDNIVNSNELTDKLTRNKTEFN